MAHGKQNADLGDYQLLEELGRGASGVVYKARHVQLGRLVAIKVLAEGVFDSASAIRFERECLALRSLDHENIIRIAEAQVVDGRHFLVMDYVPGQSLDQVVRRSGPLSVERAIRCVIHAARGLECIHQRGIVHRDIKPANLLLGDDGIVRILDLGLARLRASSGTAVPMDTITGTGQVMGTVDYISPEQAADSRDVDQRSDIYSLGCTLYYLLAGKPPYPGDSTLERLLAHVEQPPPSLSGRRPDVSAALDAVLQRMVAKSPQDRYASATHVVAALESLQDISELATDDVSLVAGAIESTIDARAGSLPAVARSVSDGSDCCDSGSDSSGDEEAIAQYMLLIDRGERVDREQFIAEHPEHADALRKFFTDLDSVESQLPAAAGSSASESDVLPERIGRYRIDGLLGQGAFGRVYRGFDRDLDRTVAIKMPRAERVSSAADIEQYLAEARILASLDHPGIVPIHDVGRTGDGLCYVVSKWIGGQDLASFAKRQTLSFDQIARLVATVAETLQHVHHRGLVHRDIKPANILIDAQGQACLTDFGLALKDEDFGQGPGMAGTVAYLSPEQARAESHLVDGRSDIFALGVVLYELLTGVRPFTGRDLPDVLRQITTVEARPLHQRNADIPKELERICLKALAKRAADRYSCAADLAEDLRHWQQAASASAPWAEASEKPAKIVPKGLRSFDAQDRDFFLELLPGPRDRDGLPETLRFWKTRIEETDPARTFRVGLIYGPSGCGKSSLVKAGLQPRLADYVIQVFVECTGQDTEARLLLGLRKAVPALSRAAGLPEALAELRRGHGLTAVRKVLIVLDQFEQWLHARGSEPHPELAAALRQCDGGAVQAVLLVRDDFWMPATRFLRQLEVRLLEDENMAAVDLFDTLHARRVLAHFGRAYGCLPENPTPLAPGEEAFLDRAIRALEEDGKVICVRLALFADMMKGHAWTPDALREVGGTAGIGATFLEETFSARTAPPAHRQHARAARAVLAVLLPAQGASIKGHMQSFADLLAASGYARHPEAFADLIHILDREIRLITPTTPQQLEMDDDVPLPADLGTGTAPDAAGAGQAKDAAEMPDSLSAYQLTHDYLVPSLREWLTRKQKETRRGRAEIRLAERSALWNAKPENRHLPSWWEYSNIRCLVPGRQWTPSQSKMMGVAGRVHLVRAALMLVLLLGAGAATVKMRHDVVAQQHRTRAVGVVDALVNADTLQVPEIVQQLEQYKTWAEPLIAERLRQAPDDSLERLHLSVASVARDDSQVEYVYGQLLQADPNRFRVIRDALSGHRQRIRDRLWAVVAAGEDDPSQQRLRAAAALAAYDPQNPAWTDVAADVAAEMVTVNPVFLGQWQEALRPVRQQLLDPLAAISNDPEQEELPRSLATTLLADYAQEDPARLTSLLVDADSRRFAILFPVLQQYQQAAVKELHAVLDRQLEPRWNDPPPDPLWLDPPAAVRISIEAAQGMFEDRFVFCQTMPLDEFIVLAEDLRGSGYRPIRFRPYAVGDTVLVAAVWTRDGREWRFDYGLDAARVGEQEARVALDGFVPVDVAGYLTDLATAPASIESDETPSAATLGERYTVLWARRLPDEPDSRTYVGASGQEHSSVIGALAKEGFASLHGLHAFRGLDGQQRYSGVCGQRTDNAHVKSMTLREFESTDYPDQTPRDVTVSQADRVPSVAERLRVRMDQADQALQEHPAHLVARLTRANCLVHLDRLEDALAELNRMIEEDENCLAAYRLRALVHAYRGDADRLAADIQQLERLGLSEFDRRGWAALGEIAKGNYGDAAERLEALPTWTEAQPVDLIPLAALDTARGRWSRVDGCLSSPIGIGMCIALPVQPSPAYTLRIVVTPSKRETKGATGLMIGLAMGHALFQATLDWRGGSGLENVDETDIRGFSNPYSGRVLTDGQTAIIEFDVQDGSLDIRRNGENILQWKGEAARLSRNPYWMLGADATLFVGAHDKHFFIHSITLVSREGSATPLRDLTNVEAIQRARWHAIIAAAYDARQQTTLATEHRNQTRRLLASLTTLTDLSTVQTDFFLSKILPDPAPADQQRYTSIWREDALFEARRLCGLSPEDHRQQCRQLSQQGYRPVAISAATLIDDTAVVTASSGSLIRSASIWHRPLVADADEERLAQHKANAGAALLRMQVTAPVWPLLRHQADPRLQTCLIHRLGPLGVDSRMLVKRLLDESEPSIRRALILSLGEYDRATADTQSGRSGRPPTGLAPLPERLLEVYRNDPDPGIHGAASWLLRRWGYGEEVRQIDHELATGKIEGDRRWLINKQGQTFVVIPGPVEFLMGSPPGERDRQPRESRQRYRIEETYAIGSTQVTLEQFRRFRLDFGRHLMHHSPDNDCPLQAVTWYEAAAYCNWLSREEGLEEDQWCYAPNAQGLYGQGMRLAPNWSSRSGYRLPTVAEWEHACRADTSTSYSFGESRELLKRYAWYQGTSRGRSWPVGILLPNGFGLFDMHGNAWEWCQEWHQGYHGAVGVRLDDGMSAGVFDSVPRATRGGGWDDYAGACRSATSRHSGPSNRSSYDGFRLAFRVVPRVSDQR